MNMHESKGNLEVPKPINVDGEWFYVAEQELPLMLEPMLFVAGPKLTLSPHEAEELRDFLTKALEYIEKRDKEIDT